MTTEEFTKAVDKFTLPLSPSEIVWKIQSNNKNTTVVPYIDNRAVMQRLDDCFGSHNWKNEFDRWGNSKGVKCGISINIEGNWITKFDGADESHIEPTKGGFSDSMKRASTQWGLGRDLYDYPRVMFKGKVEHLKEEHLNKLGMIANGIFGKQENREFIFIDLEQQQPAKPQQKPVLKEGTKDWDNVVKYLKTPDSEMAKVEGKFTIPNELKIKLLDAAI